MLYTCWDIGISSLRTGILDYWLPLAPHNEINSFIEFLDRKNMGRAVGIMQLSCIQSELLVFKFLKKIICICSRHIEFLSDNIDAIFVTFRSPTIFRKVAFQLVSCGLEMAAKRSAWWAILPHLAVEGLNTIFVLSHNVHREPRKDPSNRGLNEHGYISNTARNWTHNLFLPPWVVLDLFGNGHWIKIKKTF